MSDSNTNSEQKFLHDIATPISILSIILKKLTALSAANPSEIDLGKINSLLVRAMNSVKKLEELHSQQKTLNYKSQSSQKDVA